MFPLVSYCLAFTRDWASGGLHDEADVAIIWIIDLALNQIYNCKEFSRHAQVTAHTIVNFKHRDLKGFCLYHIYIYLYTYMSDVYPCFQKRSSRAQRVSHPHRLPSVRWARSWPEEFLWLAAACLWLSLLWLFKYASENLCVIVLCHVKQVCMYALSYLFGVLKLCQFVWFSSSSIVVWSSA